MKAPSLLIDALLRMFMGTIPPTHDCAVH